MSHTDLRGKIVRSLISDDKGSILIVGVLDNLEALVTQQVTAARIDEGDLVVDKMNELNDSAFYSWLNDRQKALHSTLIKDKKEEK